MLDMRIAQLVQTWLSVIAPYVDYQRCCEAAKVGLEHGNELLIVSLSYVCMTIASFKLY